MDTVTWAKCTANFGTSSKETEAQGAFEVWGRSTEKQSLQYVDFVGDVDCSSHQDVAKPKASRRWGGSVKSRFVGYVQQKM